MLQIFNSLTKRKEPFVPLHPNKVGVYACGITAYDFCHIGHGRMYASFDIIVRYLRARGYEVNYVRNITDVDDKIIQRAHQNNESPTALTERFINAFNEDMHALNILPPDLEPRATNHIAEIITMIEQLISKEFAYVASNGDVYFAVNKFPSYGELAHQDLEKLRSGSRVAITEAKEDPLDFVLWKLAKPGEPEWESPWGMGRPGWHIECSAMSIKCLGAHFDIHGGGYDLVFPHHQNEIAQSEAATGQRFVNVWMHVGFVQVDKEKMSKSLGNFFTIRDVLKDYAPEVMRYFLISSHYRSPLNYTTELLDGARAALERMYLALRDLVVVDSAEKSEFNLASKTNGSTAQVSHAVNNNTVIAAKIADFLLSNAAAKVYQDRFNAAMDDDFNTPEALAVLFDVVREINRVRNEDVTMARQLALFLKHLGGILGILQQAPEEFLRGSSGPATDAVSEDQINALIAARNKARQEKNWQQADELRDQLAKLGITIEDGASGTSWRRV